MASNEGKNVEEVADLDLITVVCGTKKWTIDRKLLCGKSLFFATAFSCAMTEKREKLIDIKDADPEVFAELIRYIQCGEINSDFPILEGLLEAGEQFMIEDIKTDVSYMLSNALNEDNVVSMFDLAETFNATILKDACIKFIVEKNLEFNVPHRLLVAGMKELRRQNMKSRDMITRLENNLEQTIKENIELRVEFDMIVVEEHAQDWDERFEEDVDDLDWVVYSSNSSESGDQFDVVN